MAPPLPKIYLLGNVENITDYLDREQVNSMLDAAMIASRRDYLLLQVLWRTGARVSELANIRPRDIEWANQVVNIAKGKGGKQRRVLLDEKTVQMLSNYVSSQNIGEEQPVFDLKRRQIGNIVKKYGKMIGVDGRPHTFSHSFAIHLVRSGMDLRRVQLLLGHSTLNMTQIYLQFKDDDIREVYQR